MSVVVPVLDEAERLPGVLDHLASLEGRFEIIIADGGSSDGSLELAGRHRLRPLVTAAPGERGGQLNAAAACASGELLVFLHADTFLPSDAYASLCDAAHDRAVVGGNFRISFEGGDRFSRFLGRLARVQRTLGVYYGDSAVFVRRSVFEELGGFRELSLMDDYDLVRRLERLGRTACLPGPAIASARRWRRLGVTRTLASWAIIQLLFSAGVAPARLARLYAQVR